MVVSDWIITSWDGVEKVEICSRGKVFVLVVGVAWGREVGIHSSTSVPVPEWEFSHEVRRGRFQQR